MALVQRSRGRVAFDGVPTVPGLVYILGGALTSTVSFLDIVLPSQYAWFHLSLMNFGASDPVNDNLCFAWSSNAGTTFIGGAGLTGTYAMTHQQAQWIESVATTETAGFQDSLGYVGGSWPVGAADATGKYFVTADLFPGSATAFAVWNDVVKVELPVSASAANNVAFLSSQTTLDRSSAGIVAAARINLLRLLPYANGDTTPPTGHGLASGGSYALWGFKA